MKINKILLGLITAILLAGCQPTPEKEIVINKGDDSLQRAIEATPVPEQFVQITPSEKWQETLEPSGSGVTINIDAEIDIPQVTAYPVLTVTPHTFTLEDAKKYVDYFMKGQPIYEYTNIEIKEDIADKIVKTKALIEEADTLDFSNENLRQDYIDTLTKQLNKYEKQYESAPETAPKKEITALEFKTSKFNLEGQEKAVDCKEICVNADLGKTSPAVLGISVFDNNLNNSIDFKNVDADTSYQRSAKTAGVLGLSITREEAQRIAEKTLKDLGISNMQVTSIEIWEDTKAADDSDRKGCYTFNFSPVFNGIIVTDVKPLYGIQSDDSGGDNYAQVWQDEELSIRIDDTGIIRFSWSYPADMDETLNANVGILGLDEVKDIFRNQICYQRSWNSSGFKNNTITINKVLLGYMRVRVKDENSYILIPVWDFIGDWYYSLDLTDGSGSSNSTITNFTGASFLTVNAINGSIIDRYLGY